MRGARQGRQPAHTVRGGVGERRAHEGEGEARLYYIVSGELYTK